MPGGEYYHDGAALCKADLLTGMVVNSRIAGIIGYEYLKSSEPEVALAIKEHYQPGSSEMRRRKVRPVSACPWPRSLTILWPFRVGPGADGSRTRMD